VIRVPEQRRAILGGHSGGAQPTGERVPQVVHARPLQADRAARVLPAGVVHRVDAMAPEREHPDRMQATLSLHD
jgi:hypothetical protein